MIQSVIMAAAAVIATPALSAPDVKGDWVTQDRSAIVTIAPCGKSLCGTIAKALIIKPGHPQSDVHNPDPRLRARKLIGLQILSGFAPGGDRWAGGRIYDPESGKSYRSLLRLNPDQSLKVSGCIAFFCQSQRWTRR
ncbi:MAG: hypothetical protein JWN69_1272 [Alphaproteobacteria bacterium]|nr:hypothetical protein [Alphaproteobacteria bacterium]